MLRQSDCILLRQGEGDVEVILEEVENLGTDSAGVFRVANGIFPRPHWKGDVTELAAIIWGYLSQSAGLLKLCVA